ncbi:hypothetical protein LRAMOSA09350 [Lichtheimia ramosa]|uniref:Apoptogenic protein 1, mitochondrial n=1 Tax=Lichtheimia ramosa TaxID=688394 RepID=A0A077WHG8_9FUNG|nr:hypothetical protein LRAMOSA09350 [Lichtheimia ramosa]
MQRCQRLLQFRPPLTRCNTTQAKSQSLLQPVAADMIGTPDPVTNLRPVRYYVPPDETQEEKEWRLQQERVDEYNQNFWRKNNTMFTEAKAEYEEKLRQNGEQVTAEAMSVFYKDFLNKAYERQMEYNRTWWKLNIGLLYPGFKASWRWLTKSRSQPRSSIQKETNFWAKSFES